MPTPAELVFYPSMVMHLTLRIDEAVSAPSNSVENARAGRPVPETSSERRDRIRRAVRSFGARSPEEIAEQLDLERLRSSVVPDDSVGRQNISNPVEVPNQDGLNRIMHRVPKNASVDLNGLRQAWKFNATFDFRDFPVDPRMVRACAVEVHLGTTPAGDFAQGQLGRTNDGRLLSQITTRRQLVTNQDTLVMYGVVDTMSVEHAETGSTVAIEGRDLRGIFLDAKVPPEKINTIDLTKDIVDIVIDVLRTVPVDLDINIDVVTNTDEWANRGGIPSLSGSGKVTRFRKSATGNKTRSSVSSQSDKVSYWDLITKYCFLAGAIPYFYGHQLWIRPARSVFDQQNNRSFAPPFLGQSGGREPRSISYEDGSVETYRVRKLIYGRDLQEVNYERKFGGNPVPIVEIVTLDDRARGMDRVVKVQWPPDGSRAALMKADSERLRIPIVGGVRDRDALTQMAKSVYEEAGRGEMGGSASTKSLTSFGGDSADPDMLRLRPTDAVELLVDRRALASQTPLVSELVEHNRRSDREEIDAVARVLDGRQVPDVAPSEDARRLATSLVAAARSSATELRFFRTSNVKFAWDGSGIKTAFDFQNYVVARHSEPDEVSTSTAPSPNAVQKKTVEKRTSDRNGGRKGRVPSRSPDQPTAGTNPSVTSPTQDPAAFLANRVNSRIIGGR